MSQDQRQKSILDLQAATFISIANFSSLILTIGFRGARVAEHLSCDLKQNFEGTVKLTQRTKALASPANRCYAKIYMILN